MTANPFGGGHAANPSPTSANPRGPSFAIRSGGKTYRGKAINGEYLRSFVAQTLENWSREMASEIGSEVKRLIRERCDPMAERMSALEQRLAFLEGELGVDAKDFRGGQHAV